MLWGLLGNMAIRHPIGCETVRHTVTTCKSPGDLYIGMLLSRRFRIDSDDDSQGKFKADRQYSASQIGELLPRKLKSRAEEHHRRMNKAFCRSRFLTKI